MSAATAETFGRGRFELLRDELKGRHPSGGSDGLGSEKNRTLFPDGGRLERIADGGMDGSPGCSPEVGGMGSSLKGAKNAVSRVGSSSA